MIHRQFSYSQLVWELLKLYIIINKKKKSNIIIRLGTNQIDISQTGIPYFKHDFGYEFGVVYPVKMENSKTANPMDSVSIPVIHEFSKTIQNQTSQMSNYNIHQEHFKTTGDRILLG